MWKVKACGALHLPVYQIGQVLSNNIAKMYVIILNYMYM